MPLTARLPDTASDPEMRLMIPGQRDPGTLTRFAAERLAVQTMADVTVDAALRADRQREGGGAASERRAVGRSLWRGFVDAVEARWHGGRAATLVATAPVAPTDS